MKFTLNYPIRRREPKGGVAIQDLWIASSLTLLATTGYAKVSQGGEDEYNYPLERARDF